MNEQSVTQHLLRTKLTEMRARNPRASVRAFAKRLGLSPAATNEILKGERRVSHKIAERIATKLALDPSERNELLKHFPKNNPLLANTKGMEDDSKLLKLSADQFAAISGWIHFAILSLVKNVDFQNDVGWIAGRLGVTEKQAKDATERLLRLNLLTETKNGSLRRTHERLNTSDDVLNPAIQRSHIEDMELVQQSLLHDPVELRDFTSITMAASPELLPEAKRIIRQAQDQIAALFATRPFTEVYKMSVHLFPLTKKDKSDSGEKK